MFQRHVMRNIVTYCCILSVTVSTQVIKNSTTANWNKNHRNCIECRKITGLTLLPGSKNIFWNSNFLYDSKQFDDIGLREKCLKPSYKIFDEVHFVRNEKNPYKYRKTVYSRENQLSRWFSYWTNVFIQYLPYRKNICVECARRRKVVSFNKRNPSHYEQFKTLLYGSVVRRNIHSHTCYLPEHIKSRIKNRTRLKSDVQVNKVLYTHDAKNDTDQAGWFAYIYNYLKQPSSVHNRSQVALKYDNISQLKFKTPSNQSSLLHKEWYNWFLRTLRLHCSSNVEVNSVQNGGQFSNSFTVDIITDTSDQHVTIGIPSTTEGESLSNVSTSQFVTTDAHTVSKLSYEQWFYRLQLFFRFVCPNHSRATDETPAAVLKDHSTLRKNDDDALYSRWWSRLILSFKMFTKNRYFVVRKQHSDVYKEFWYNRFVTFTQLSSQNNTSVKFLKDRVSKLQNFTRITYDWYHQFLSYFKLTCLNPTKYKTKEVVTDGGSIHTENETTNVSQNGSSVAMKLDRIEKSNIQPAVSSVVMVTRVYKEHVIKNTNTCITVESNMLQYARRKLLHVTRRHRGGEVNDAILFVLIISCLMLWFLQKKMTSLFTRPYIYLPVPNVTGMKCAEEIPTEAKPTTDIKRSPTKLKSRKMLEPPAAVIAARRKLELELVVAVVDIGPFPTYPSNMRVY